ncbi:hypothetical protein RchiOBHm_Chr3g0450821 [Rosa chinensis]|uniref:Uncharacterized protein n=1 Tax=Rosa chinensis TaxID=74649 RepID=A0A2P6R5W1_ROSCH|nr:hypothetical protein RchiOBHm_Chr3g0450821 [Rosa chinensis]
MHLNFRLMSLSLPEQPQRLHPSVKQDISSAKIFTSLLFSNLTQIYTGLLA